TSIVHNGVPCSIFSPLSLRQFFNCTENDHDIAEQKPACYTENAEYTRESHPKETCNYHNQQPHNSTGPYFALALISSFQVQYQFHSRKMDAMVPRANPAAMDDLVNK